MINEEGVILLFKQILGRDITGQNEYISKQVGKNSRDYSLQLINSEEFRVKKNNACDIIFLGNCQVESFSTLVASMSGLKTRHVLIHDANLRKILSGDIYIAADVVKAKYIVTHGLPGALADFLKRTFEISFNKIINIPAISFPAFHPDMIYIGKGTERVNRYVGDYQSFIAFRAWNRGLSIDEALDLYCNDVYEKLGYFDYLKNSKKFLIKRGLDLGFSLNESINKWLMRDEPFMYSVNHPKLFVLEDLAKQLMKKLKIPYNLGVSSHVADALANGLVWSVYPEVGKHFGFESSYAFRIGGKVHGLREFLELSYKNFDSFGRGGQDFTHDRVNSATEKILDEIIQESRQKEKITAVAVSSGSTEVVGLSDNPYKKIPDLSFWRKNVASPHFSQVDPVSASKFSISPQEKVATAGSCFAQHISKTLVKNGFNYYVPENGDGLSEEDRKNGNYAVFSARYGNLYTARQLRQLFERAYSIIKPHQELWVRPDGAFSDPFRPEIEARGFPTKESLLSAQTQHLASVREMFENLDVFVFTLGLTETWMSKVDGSVYPLAPGVVAGGFDDNLYEFKNMGVSDVVEDMQIFLDYLNQVNSKAKLILTVSPVPLIATYTGKSALSATIYSKSVLRSAAQHLADENDNVDYFPSYEIITGNHVGNGYYDTDLRSVRPEGVSHVMGLFMKHYTNQVQPENLAVQRPDIENELKNVSEIICDEEKIVNFRE